MFSTICEFPFFDEICSVEPRKMYKRKLWKDIIKEKLRRQKRAVTMFALQTFYKILSKEGIAAMTY